MGNIRRFITRILSPRKANFLENFEAAFIESIRVTSGFDTSVRNIAQTWLAVCPNTYFAELFIERVNWNRPFLRAFGLSDMVNAQECFKITQSYYLTNLFRVMYNDKDYKNYSKKLIEKNILTHLESGQSILELSSEFEKQMSNPSVVEVLSLCYVEKVLKVQFPNNELFESAMASILKSSESMFGLTLFYTEAMKRAKLIDKHT